eukprot:810442_1
MGFESYEKTALAQHCSSFELLLVLDTQSEREKTFFKNKTKISIRTPTDTVHSYIHRQLGNSMNPSGETYWEGMYWDGFSPEDMGAVPLEEVECLTDPIIQKALEKCRKLIAQDPDLSVTDFYVTMDEEMLLIDNDSVSEHTSSQAHGTPSQSDQTPSEIANQRSIQSDETPDQSDQTPNQTEDTVPSNQTNQTPNQIDQTPNQSDQIPNQTSNDHMPVLVCKMWHKNVFSGARDAGVADPAAFCRDYIFRKSDGNFLRERQWEK